MAGSSSAALSASVSLVVLQVVSRLFSFGLNQLLLRSTSPQAFGVATIRLDTWIGTVLFFVREGIRGAVARAAPVKSAEDIGRRRQTLLIPTLLSPVALLACAAFYNYASPTPLPPQYPLTFLLYSVSILIELVSEPAFLTTLASWQTLTTKRVKVEGVALLVKAIATLIVAQLVSEREALVAFGVGQLAYSATVWAGLAAVAPAAPSPASALTLKRTGAEATYLDKAVLETGWALTKQSVVKQMLTEGDKFAVGRFGSSADMGGYAVALNYGSLIARVVFQPLEESSRLYFSSLAAASESSESGGEKDGTRQRSPPLRALASCASYLRLVLLFQTHLALIFFLLAPCYTTPLLHLLLGPKWSLTSASPILRAYAMSLPFLGLNGITEAFFQAVADPEWIQRGAGWMVLCGGAFAGTVWVTVQGFKMGAVGLVLANCVNMFLRTAFSTLFIVQYFHKVLSDAEVAEGPTRTEKNDTEGDEERLRHEARRSLDWRSWTPSLWTFSTFVLGGYVCRRSEADWVAAVMAPLLSSKSAPVLDRRAELHATGKHLGVGAAMGLLGLASVALSHRQELRAVLARRKIPTHKKED